jgi:thioredoxin-like negative regulator of GroEL
MKLSKSLDKMMTRRVNTLKMMFRPSNLPKLFSLLVLLGVLYYVYKTYFKEAMTDSDLSGGYETTPAQFDTDVLGGSGKKLCVFYAGWCGHCHKLMEDSWDSAASNMNTGDRSTWKLWKVNVGGDKSPNDATPEQEALGQKYNVQGYPTIYIFENGNLVTEYEGPRTADGYTKALS